MRTLVWFVYFWLYALCSIPLVFFTSYLYKKGRIAERDDIISKNIKMWAGRLLKLAGAQAEIIGIENLPDSPAVYVSNHQGNFDIPLFFEYLGKPKGFFTKSETRRLPIISYWMKSINCIFIDRKSPAKSIKSMEEAKEKLGEGYSFVIFPEGTRGRGGPLNSFKSGAFRLARDANTPIVPITIDGTYKLMEANNGFIKPGNVRVIVHPIIDSDEVSSLSIKDLKNKVLDIISSGLENK